MKILALERDLPSVSGENFSADLLRQEAERAWEMHQSGVIRELYFRFDKNMAVLVLECADANEAKRILDTLPLVREKLVDFEIIPLTAYPGFARLFGGQLSWGESLTRQDANP